MKGVCESLWSLIASAANEPEIEEIAHIVGNRRIKDNEVRMYSYTLLPLTAIDLSLSSIE